MTNVASTAESRPSRLNRRFPEKPKAFVIFTDLDGTFTPIGIKGLVDFCEMVGEITRREKVQVKFVPVSGRPCGYVLRVLHEVRDILKGKTDGLGRMAGIEMLVWPQITTFITSATSAWQSKAP